MMTPKQDIARFFDVYAHDFAAICDNPQTAWTRIINKYFRRSMILRFTKTLEGCRPIHGKAVIDIGCGPGHYTIALAQRGAAYVCGIDFAKGMIDIAKEKARSAGVARRCHFILGDFMATIFPEPFDYAVVMGVMDYIQHPEEMVREVLSVTRDKAFFSFPVDGGLLAWQRKLRYARRCPLFMYTAEQVRNTFADAPHAKLEVEQIDRDFFVTCHVGR